MADVVAMDGCTLPEKRDLASKSGYWVCCGLGHRGRQTREQGGATKMQWGSQLEHCGWKGIVLLGGGSMAAVDSDLRSERPAKMEVG